MQWQLVTAHHEKGIGGLICCEYNGNWSLPFMMKVSTVWYVVSDTCEGNGCKHLFRLCFGFGTDTKWLCSMCHCEPFFLYKSHRFFVLLEMKLALSVW